MLTAAVLDADWAARRLIGRGLRRDRLDPAGADPTTPASFETSVIRLPIELATQLRAVADALVAIQPMQYPCPAETIHVTVCGPAHLTAEHPAEAALDDLRDLVPPLAGCRLRVVRLGIGDTSLFAGIEAHGADLAATRRELAGRWGVPTRGGPAAMVIGRMFWANVVRFTEPPSPAFIAAARRYRRVRHAGFAPETIELVRTNRTMAPAETTILGRVEVPAAAEG